MKVSSINIRSLLVSSLFLSLSGLSHAQIVFSNSFVDGTDYVDNGGYIDGVSAGQFNSVGMSSSLQSGATGGSLSLSQARIKHDLGGSYGDANETLFVSYLFQTNSNNFSGNGAFFAMELYQESGTISTGDSKRTYNIGLLRGNGDTKSAQFEHNVDTGLGASVASLDANPDLGLFNTDTNLLVMRFDFTNGGQDYEINAWLNPANTGTVAGTNATISGTGLDFNAFGFTAFASSTDANYDEIIFSTTASGLGLAPVPEPSTSVLLIGLSGLVFCLYRRKKM